MKVYQHNMYYRIDENEIMPKLILAARLNKDDRKEILSTATIGRFEELV
mgnify:CR=1 FL=1